MDEAHKYLERKNPERHDAKEEEENKMEKNKLCVRLVNSTFFLFISKWETPSVPNCPINVECN